jgi:hypothetical protein
MYEEESASEKVNKEFGWSEGARGVRGGGQLVFLEKSEKKKLSPQHKSGKTMM